MTKSEMKKKCNTCDLNNHGWCELYKTNNIEEKISKCIPSKDEMVQISKAEYTRLLSRDEKLSALEEYGVDNWGWYGEAISSLENEDE